MLRGAACPFCLQYLAQLTVFYFPLVCGGDGVSEGWDGDHSLDQGG